MVFGLPRGKGGESMFPADKKSRGFSCEALNLCWACVGSNFQVLTAWTNLG